MDRLNIYGSPNVPAIVDPRAVLLANHLRHHRTMIEIPPEIPETRKLRAMNLVYAKIVEHQGIQIRDMQKILDKNKPFAKVCDYCSELYTNDDSDDSDVCAGCHTKLHYCHECAIKILLVCANCHIHICANCVPDNAPCLWYCGERRIRGYDRN
jgi:hypothetical protein